MEANPKSKPLHRDVSFWIVVVTLVGAANAAQLYYGIPWMRAKLSDARPAPRVEAADQPAIRDVFTRVEPQLDNSRKTYAWQVPRFNESVFESAPEQVILNPSEFSAPSGGWSVNRNGKRVGIRVSAREVLQSAFSWHFPSRILCSEPWPEGTFDFIANRKSGASEALQSEIRSRWNLTARTELIVTNAFVLRLQRTNAPGMKPSVSSSSRMHASQSTFTMGGVSVETLANHIEIHVRRPVLNQTGLDGTYDIEFPRYQGVRIAGIQTSDPAAHFRTVLPEHLGLELIETNAPVEMLVIKKAH